MEKIDPCSVTPLYQQLYETILQRIIDGQYRAGERIPSEPQLSAEFSISRITVRTALQRLVDDGILVKKHGKGTYVSFHLQTETFFPGGSFTDTCYKMNMTPSTKILSLGVIEGTRNITEKLSLEPASSLIHIKRLRSMDQTPCILENDYFSMDYEFLLDESLDNKSLFSVISSKKNKIIASFEDYFSIKFASKELGALLDCRQSFPLLLVCQTVLSDTESPLYYNEQLIHCERYTYAIHSTTKSRIEIL